VHGGEAFREAAIIDDRVVGLQFHLETTPNAAQALIDNFTLLEMDFPVPEGSPPDPHVIAGWIGYSLLEGIAALTGRKPRDCMDGLTRVAALTLYDKVDFSSPERFVETVTSRLGGYLAAGKTS